MFIEWNDGINPYVDFRGSIKQFHDKLTAPGTNVTHLAEKEGQFDFDAEVLPASTSYGINKFSKPLYYKFACIGKKEVYITLVVSSVKINNNTVFVQYSLGVVRVSDTFKLFTSYISTDSVIHTKSSVTYETYVSGPCNWFQLQNKPKPIGGTYGYIYIDETEGILSFGHALGLYTQDEPTFKKYPLFFAMIKADVDSIMFIRPTYIQGTVADIAATAYDVSNTTVSSVAINSVGIAQYHNLMDLTIGDVPLPAIMEYYFLNASGNLEVLKGVFVYNYKVHSEIGLQVIDGRSFYFLGDGISTWNISMKDNLSFAFEVTV